MMHLWIYLRPKTKISRKECNRLKDQIRKRLRSEDYTCRLSDPPKNVMIKDLDMPAILRLVKWAYERFTSKQ